MAEAANGFEDRRVQLGEEHREALARILPELRSGRVILLPTDTIYGVSCRWDSERARVRIQAMKGSTRAGLFVALVSSLEMALEYAETPGPAGLEILTEQWPGPVTVVLRAKEGIAPAFCLGPGGTIAFRWPRGRFLQELVRDLGVPLISTSANRTGEPNVVEPRQAWDLFGGAIDLYVDAGKLDGPPSTLIDLTGEKPHLLRLGVSIPPGVQPPAGKG
jgi:tRNA threonylcarbamoyl adenosine modification protein (Sua5/YciO/YrdC/YwlC family)